MQNSKVDLGERMLDFAAGIIRLTTLMEKSYTARHISGQLMRSATSAGANWEEAGGAESRPDFIHKQQVALKELRESLFWLRLIEKSGICPQEFQDFGRLKDEARQLTRIVAKSIITSKEKQK
ncbi:MAG: four helix bundle protein [Candidatus Zixiibacteriota bacterium]|nr:MAG: four helix bundle protein [candidate division Zixibacteria bacterium]